MTLFRCLLLLFGQLAVVVISLSTTATTVGGIGTRPTLTYRNLQEADLDRVADLVSEVFDGPFERDSWNVLEVLKKKKSLFRQRTELQRRFERITSGKELHAMYVVTEDEPELDAYQSAAAGREGSKGYVVGFVEIGMLPSPIKEEKEWNGVTAKSTVDVPYIGNLVVNKEWRRNGIASKMVRIALKVAEKWQYEKIFLAVDFDNSKALNLYRKLGFECILDEQDMIFGKKKDCPRSYWTLATGYTRPSLEGEEAAEEAQTLEPRL